MNSYAIVDTTGQSTILQTLISFPTKSVISLSGKGTVWKTLRDCFGGCVTIGEVMNIINEEPELQNELRDRHPEFKIGIQ